MAKLRTFNAAEQTAKVRASSKAAAPPEMKKNGLLEVALPPTKAPVRLPKGRRVSLPGHASVQKQAMPKRGEKLPTPNLIGTWSTR